MKIVSALRFYSKNKKIFFRNLFFRLRSLFVTEKYDLIILDNIFPNPISAFRYEEFLCYLKHFDGKVCIYTLGEKINDEFEIEDNYIRRFVKKNPKFKNQIKRFEFYRKVSAKLAYSLFVDNTFSYLEYYKKNKIPFTFTLYPGAGFFLNQETTDSKLKAIFSSDLFRGVVATQKITVEYLKQKKICYEGLITFIPGVVVPEKFITVSNPEKKIESSQFRIAFVANKQLKIGYDKGYDIFIDAAKRILDNGYDAKFFVVGPFSNSDIDVSKYGRSIIFKGFLETTKFTSFYREVDMMISPNRAFVLRPGAFDGFPTAAATEAALNGVPIMVTDPLDLNIYFEDGKNIIFIKPEVDNVCEKIIFYYKNREKLKEIGLRGKAKFSDVYSHKNQIEARINFLEKNIV